MRYDPFASAIPKLPSFAEITFLLRKDRVYSFVALSPGGCKHVIPAGGCFFGRNRCLGTWALGHRNVFKISSLAATVFSATMLVVVPASVLAVVLVARWGSRVSSAPISIASATPSGVVESSSFWDYYGAWCRQEIRRDQISTPFLAHAGAVFSARVRFDGESDLLGGLLHASEVPIFGDIYEFDFKCVPLSRFSRGFAPTSQW